MTPDATKSPAEDVAPPDNAPSLSFGPCVTPDDEPDNAHPSAHAAFTHGEPGGRDVHPLAGAISNAAAIESPTSANDALKAGTKNHPPLARGTDPGKRSVKAKTRKRQTLARSRVITAVAESRADGTNCCSPPTRDTGASAGIVCGGAYNASGGPVAVSIAAEVTARNNTAAPNPSMLTLAAALYLLTTDEALQVDLLHAGFLDGGFYRASAEYFVDTAIAPGREPALVKQMFETVCETWREVAVILRGVFPADTPPTTFQTSLASRLPTLYGDAAPIEARRCELLYQALEIMCAPDTLDRTSDPDCCAFLQLLEEWTRHPLAEGFLTMKPSGRWPPFDDILSSARRHVSEARGTFTTRGSARVGTTTFEGRRVAISVNDDAFSIRIEPLHGTSDNRA